MRGEFIKKHEKEAEREGKVQNSHRKGSIFLWGTNFQRERSPWGKLEGGKESAEKRTNHLSLRVFCESEKTGRGRENDGE